MELDFEGKEQYLSAIADLPDKDSYSQKDLLVEDLLLFQDDNLEIYYTPFDYIKTDARLAIIGITPGWTQMELACRTFREGMRDQKSMPHICAELERRASFAGSMKKNLVSMLDELNVGDVLGVGFAASLFGKHQELVHTTSAVRYATFLRGQNYTGHKPRMLEHGKLREFVEKVLAPELNRVEDALVIPLGKAVTEAMKYLTNKKLMNPRRCLLDFPHPSGANGHRMKQFAERKSQFSETIEDWLAS